MNANDNLEALRVQEQKSRFKVEQMRRQVYGRDSPAETGGLIEQLAQAEGELHDLREQIAAAEVAERKGVIVEKKRGGLGVMGADTTGLEATVYLRQSQVPTSIYHLLDTREVPLLTIRVKNAGIDGKTRRVRVTSFIEGYSAKAIDTMEMKPSQDVQFDQLPTLFPLQCRELTEVTRATLGVLVDDLDTGKVEIQATYPIWMLARTSAPLAVRDPQTGHLQDLTRYLGAFVTPNAPPIMEFLRTAADLSADGQFIGYQGEPSRVEPQIKALYDALQSKTGVRYVNSVVDFNPDQGTATQRIRLPRESLAHREANCIDGTVLFASLIEALSMNPGLVLIPGHAFLAWENWQDSGNWCYLETTMVGKAPFDQARKSAEKTAATFEQRAKDTNQPLMFRRWSLQELRTRYNITPME